MIEGFKQQGMINFADQFIKNVHLLPNSDANDIKMAICRAHVIDYQVIEKIEKLKFKRIKNPNNNQYINQVKEWQISRKNVPNSQNFMFYYN